MEKLLILGGTNFIGRNLVDSLLKLNDYEITLFNRGKTNPGLYPEIREIYGDRNTSDIDVVFSGNWDYIIDLSCFYPKSLSNIVTHISKGIKRYIFISTCSVYDINSDISILKNEKAPTLNCCISEISDSSIATYGKRKAECERILMHSGLKFTILRPSLVYGEYDNTDRFYYWLYNIKKGSQLLIPNSGNSIFSVTYVKDLVKAILKALFSDIDQSIYNVTTYPDLSISKLVETVSELLNKNINSCFVDSQFLEDNNIVQWTDLPLWLDSDSFTYDNKKIIEDLDMEITDFKTTVSETINYYEKSGWEKPKIGISECKTKELIQNLTI